MNYLMISVHVALVFTAAVSRAYAQQPVSAGTAPPKAELECRILTGRITDPFAYPLTGATIMLRTPGAGFSPEAYSTNSEGHYVITAKQAIPRNTVLEITAPGYATLELPLENCKPLDLTLTPLTTTSYKPRPRGKKISGNSKLR
ncbi:hypothetical protein GCM10027594_27250 [Hymenobacter agri]